MEVLNAIEARRSVKHYDPDYRMTETEVSRLMNLAVTIQAWGHA